MFDTLVKIVPVQIFGSVFYLARHCKVKSEKVQKVAFIPTAISVVVVPNVQNQCVQTRWNECILLYAKSKVLTLT